MKKHFGSDIIAGLVLLLLIFLGPFTLILGIRDLQDCVKSSKWPLARGRIIASSITSRESRDADGPTSNYNARIEFEYWVKQRRYVSSKVHAADFWEMSSSVFARKLVERFPTGKEVSPAYDPEAPWLAVLESGVHPACLGTLCFGIVLSMITAYYFIILLRSKAIAEETQLNSKS